jgi:hypothetical protein
VEQFGHFSKTILVTLVQRVFFSFSAQLFLRHPGLPDVQTKNTNLGKFWRVLRGKMLGYLVAIGKFSVRLVYFVVIWYICPHFGKKNLATLAPLFSAVVCLSGTTVSRGTTFRGTTSRGTTSRGILKTVVLVERQLVDYQLVERQPRRLQQLVERQLVERQLVEFG